MKTNLSYPCLNYNNIRLPADSTTGHLSTSLGWFSQGTNSKLPEHSGASKLHVIVRTAFMTATRAEKFMAQVACHREVQVAPHKLFPC
jgi:hypothetical protein